VVAVTEVVMTQIKMELLIKMTLVLMLQGSIANKGCPYLDTDKDGVLIKMTNVRSSWSCRNYGCPWPDTDGDGIIDDQCPTEVGTAANNGCPGYSEVIKD
jgi:hypothetical protein